MQSWYEKEHLHQIPSPPPSGNYTLCVCVSVYEYVVLVGQKLWVGLHLVSVRLVSPWLDIPVQMPGVQLPPVISVMIPFTRSAQPLSKTVALNQTPKIAQGGWGWLVWLQTPEDGPVTRLCTTLSSSNTDRRDRRGVKILWPHQPILLSGYHSARGVSLLVTCAHCNQSRKSDRVWASSRRVAGQSWTMKLSVALFFAGLFGALAAVFILLSFGTDYWLLASESCHPNPEGTVGPGGVTIEVGVRR